MANLNPKIFKAYDIRAIYPTEINEEKIVSIIKATYSFFRKKFPEDKQIRIVLGYDMRTSSPSLYPIAKQTLIDMGAHVIDIGLISTPSFYFSVFHYDYDAGIQITASHNPKEYNGVKFVMNSSRGLIKIGKSTGMDEVRDMAMNESFVEPKAGGSSEEKTGILEEEVKTALEILHNPEFKKFKVVADPANAMGAQYIQAVFDHIPSELIKMNFEFDGTFPAHQPDPLNFKNLVDLQKRMLEEQADFGLAPDGDGDRLFFIDDKGEVVPASIITGIITKEFLKDNPGAMILFDIRYILTPTIIVKENGGKSQVTKVGHAYITESMQKTGAVFAGESSAHYFYKAAGNGENQLITIMTIMKVMSQENKKLSELVDEYRRSFESGEHNFRVSNAPEILEKLKEKYSDGELSELDGIAITYPEWRFNVRTSNTEPLLRLNLESLDKSVMEAKFKEVNDFITEIGAHEEHTGH